MEHCGKGVWQLKNQEAPIQVRESHIPKEQGLLVNQVGTLKMCVAPDTFLITRCWSNTGNAVENVIVYAKKSRYILMFCFRPIRCMGIVEIYQCNQNYFWTVPASLDLHLIWFHVDSNGFTLNGKEKYPYWDSLDSFLGMLNKVLRTVNEAFTKKQWNHAATKFSTDLNNNRLKALAGSLKGLRTVACQACSFWNFLDFRETWFSCCSTLLPDVYG